MADIAEKQGLGTIDFRQGLGALAFFFNSEGRQANHSDFTLKRTILRRPFTYQGTYSKRWLS